MSDSDLKALVTDMDFTSPLRPAIGSTNPNARPTNTPRGKVLLSNSSVRTSSHEMTIFDEYNIPSSFPDDKDLSEDDSTKKDEGALDNIKKYKLFHIM